MAKQTFTTGQVLTAAQMTSLQETAMGGGPATAKTASYVLVAADAGTTVAMNAAGATTITVNTGLFAAGDTVFIQNLGTGACTVTAGTATVATAGSLILPQNDAGILYFTATGSAIFYDYIQAGAVSPLTTKGDLYTFSTSDTRLGVGANGTTLVADSAEATGLKWATPGGSNLTWTRLVNGTSLSGSSTSFTGLSGYNYLHISIRYISSNTASDTYLLRVNNDTSGIYSSYFGVINATSSYSPDVVTADAYNDDTRIQLARQCNSGSFGGSAGYIQIAGTNSTSHKTFHYALGSYRGGSATDQRSHYGGGFITNSSVISSVQIACNAGSFNGGTVYIYGGN